MDKKAKKRGEIRPPGVLSIRRDIGYVTIYTPDATIHAKGSAETVYNFFQRGKSNRCKIRFTKASTLIAENDLLLDQNRSRIFAAFRIDRDNLRSFSLQDLELLIFSLGKRTRLTAQLR